MSLHSCKSLLSYQVVRSGTGRFDHAWLLGSCNLGNNGTGCEGKPGVCFAFMKDEIALKWHEGEETTVYILGKEIFNHYMLCLGCS